MAVFSNLYMKVTVTTAAKRASKWVMTASSTHVKLRGQTENWLATNGADVAGQRAVATDDLLPLEEAQ